MRALSADDEGIPQLPCRASAGAPVTGDRQATIRVVIAEDQASVRRGTALLVSLAPDMECVGQASNGDEAVQLARVLHPDVVLMDLHMPVKGGVAATRENHACPTGDPGAGAHHAGRR